MDNKLSELKAAAMAATPGRIGDRIDGSGSIKYECTGYDGSLVMRTDHKDMEYGFVGDNADADELFFRLCVPDVVLALLAELEAKDKRIAELSRLLAHNIERAEEAEKRLATPVRLPPADSQGRYHGMMTRFAIKKAGFTVEGDE